MNAIRLADNIFWVGKVDDRKVPFHRLILERGTTYNSYLLMTEYNAPHCQDSFLAFLS